MFTHLNTNKHYCNAKHIWREHFLEDPVGDERNEPFDPYTSHDCTEEFTPSFIECISIGHDIIQNDGEDGVVLICCSHGTEYACAELVFALCKWNGDGTHLHHSSKSRTDERCRDEILCSIKCCLPVCRLFFPKGRIVDLGEVSHHNTCRRGRRDGLQDMDIRLSITSCKIPT